MDLNTIYRVIIDSMDNSGVSLVERSYDAELAATVNNSNLIKVLVGPRRAGKSMILKKLFQGAITAGVPKENLFFINFEHDLVQPELSLSGLRQMWDLFQAHSNTARPKLIALDEIQNVPGWEKFVRTLYDTKAGNIYVTGSNSNLLSTDISSALGGRVLEYEILPFCFSEILRHAGLTISSTVAAATHQAAITKLTDQYLRFGGFPESLGLSEQQQLQYRDSLIEKILLKDLCRCYRLEYPELLMKLVYILRRSLGGITSPFALSKVADYSDMTIANYLGYLSNVYLTYKLGKFNFKSKQILRTQNKLFFYDNLFIAGADYSGLLENCVLTTLLRKFGGKSLYFLRDERQKEIDLFVEAPKPIAFQVTYELNNQNVKREIAPLALLRKYYGKSCQYSLIFRFNKLINFTIPDFIALQTLEDFLLE